MPTMERDPPAHKALRSSVLGASVRNRQSRPEVEQAGEIQLTYRASAPPSGHRRTARASPASSYACLATSRQAARTPSAKIQEVSGRCDITYPWCPHVMRRDVPVTPITCKAHRTHGLWSVHHISPRPGRACFMCAHLSLHQRFIAPGGHLVSDGSEFRRGQHAARYRKQPLVFNGSKPITASPRITTTPSKCWVAAGCGKERCQRATHGRFGNTSSRWSAYTAGTSPLKTRSCFR